MKQISSQQLIQEAVRNQGNLYHVLYVYGPADKTSAFVAKVLQKMQEDRSGARVVHTNGTAFCQAIFHDSGDLLGDVLLFEDLQAVAGRETAEQSLYGILNAYLESGKQVIVTGDAPLYDMLCLASRIRPQLLGGLCVQVAD